MKLMSIHWSRITAICIFSVLFGMTPFLSVSLAEEPSAFLGSQRNTSQLFTEAVPVVEPEPAPVLDLRERASLETTTDFLSQTRQSPVLFAEEADEDETKAVFHVSPIIDSEDFGLLDPSDSRLIPTSPEYEEEYSDVFWPVYGYSRKSERYQPVTLEVSELPVLGSGELLLGPSIHSSEGCNIVSLAQDVLTLQCGEAASSHRYIYAVYDTLVNASTENPPAEGSNFREIFPEGLVIGVSSDDLKEVTLGVGIGPEEIDSVVDFAHTIILDHVTPQIQYYRITEEMFGVELKEPQTTRIGLEFTGEGEQDLQIHIKGTGYTPFVSPNSRPDPTLSADDVTPFPRESEYWPRLSVSSHWGGWVSWDPGNASWQPGPIEFRYGGTGSWSAARVTMSYRHGGEGILFEEAFPDGFVIGLSSPDLTGVGYTFWGSEINSFRGNEGELKSSGRFLDLKPEMQYYKITIDQLDPEFKEEVIKYMSFWFAGEGPDRLNVDWSVADLPPEPF